MNTRQQLPSIRYKCHVSLEFESVTVPERGIDFIRDSFASIAPKNFHEVSGSLTVSLYMALMSSVVFQLRMDNYLGRIMDLRAH